MSKPAVLIRKSTGEILKHAPYPREDMQPVIGLDPDLEWLLKHEPFQMPDYDSRIFVPVITEAVTEEPHPEHPELKTYKRTYQTQRRTDDEIIEAIQSVENQTNEELVDYQTKTKLLTIAVNALIRKDKKLILTPKEEKVIADIAAYGEKIWKNDAEKEAKVKQVKDGLEPNIDEGWERNPNANINAGS